MKKSILSRLEQISRFYVATIKALSDRDQVKSSQRFGSVCRVSCMFRFPGANQFSKYV